MLQELYEIYAICRDIIYPYVIIITAIQCIVKIPTLYNNREFGLANSGMILLAVIDLKLAAIYGCTIMSTILTKYYMEKPKTTDGSEKYRATPGKKVASSADYERWKAEREKKQDPVE